MIWFCAALKMLMSNLHYRLRCADNVNKQVAALFAHALMMLMSKFLSVQLTGTN